MKSLTELQARYQDKSTEELLDIWQKNDKTTYRAEVFEAIKAILDNRKVELPPQGKEISVQYENPRTVIISGIDVPFSDMVFFMVKWAVASVPAVIIIGIIGGLVWLLLEAIGQVLR